MSETKIICGDCLEVLPTLPKATMIFADPPDNLGVKYDGFVDKVSEFDYNDSIDSLVVMIEDRSEIGWLSYYHKHHMSVMSALNRHYMPDLIWKLFIWRFTFGQHNKYDCGSGYRPLLRMKKPDAILYPDAIREPSLRQTKYKDTRADPRGRVPDDVWEFPRVCGTFKEKRKWGKNQHPEALMERIIKFSCKPGDLVIDMFAGTGTTLRVCKRLGIDCIGIEISQVYCDKIREELNI